MTATVLDGKGLALAFTAKLTERAKTLATRNIVPGLAVFLVGDDPASQVYVRSKTKSAAAVGVRTFDRHLGADTTTEQLLEMVEAANLNPEVHGILVQLPLPAQINATLILDAISPAKDVDGFHADNIGRLAQGRPRFVAATPKGCMKLLAAGDVALAGKHAVVIGRSNIVGRPMSLLLTNADATVTLCHSRTQDIAAEVARADVVIAAVGRPNFVKGAWIKPGAAVIDVGINRVDGKLIGDVEFATAAERARIITPVPGGVGPFTIACLLENTVDSAEAHHLP